MTIVAFLVTHDNSCSYLLYRPCGCGAGESGCSECGVCRSCAGEQILEMEEHGKQIELLARHKDYLPIDVEQLLVRDDVKSKKHI